MIKLKTIISSPLKNLKEDYESNDIDNTAIPASSYQNRLGCDVGVNDESKVITFSEYDKSKLVRGKTKLLARSANSKRPTYYTPAWFDEILDDGNVAMHGIDPKYGEFHFNQPMDSVFVDTSYDYQTLQESSDSQYAYVETQGNDPEIMLIGVGKFRKSQLESNLTGKLKSLVEWADRKEWDKIEYALRDNGMLIHILNGIKEINDELK